MLHSGAYPDPRELDKAFPEVPMVILTHGWRELKVTKDGVLHRTEAANTLQRARPSKPVARSKI